MGIENISILIDPEPSDPNLRNQALVTLQQELIDEHRNGEHPWGRMIRECPLCQAS